MWFDFANEKKGEEIVVLDAACQHRALEDDSITTEAPRIIPDLKLKV